MSERKKSLPKKIKMKNKFGGISSFNLMLACFTGLP